MVGVEGFEPPTSCSQSRRATRLRYTPVPHGWFGFPGLCHARGRPAIVRSGRCRSEEHTSELQSLMRISYAVFCLKKKNKLYTNKYNYENQHKYESHSITRHSTSHEIYRCD